MMAIPVKGIASADVTAAMRHFRGMRLGDVVAYETLTAALGFDVRKNRSRVDRAIKKLIDEGCFIVCEREVGWKRVEHKDMPDVTDRDVTHMSKTARKIQRVTQNLDPEKMPAHQWQRATAQQAIAGVVRSVASKPALKRLATLEPKSNLDEHTNLLLAQIKGRKEESGGSRPGTA